MEGGEEWSWPPADMEQRRLADLKRYKLRNPGYKEPVNLENQQLQKNNNKTRGEGKVQLQGNRNKASGEGKLPKLGNSKPNSIENRWSVKNTLRLFDEMKAVAVEKNVARFSLELWELIASKLPNHRKLALENHAKICKIRMQYIRKNLRFHPERVADEVKDSVADFNEICMGIIHGQQKRRTPPSTKGNEQGPVKQSTDSLADCDGTDQFSD